MWVETGGLIQEIFWRQKIDRVSVRLYTGPERKWCQEHGSWLKEILNVTASISEQKDHAKTGILFFKEIFVQIF